MLVRGGPLDEVVIGAARGRSAGSAPPICAQRACNATGSKRRRAQRAAAEADAAELVSVLVDEADTDAVVSRDTASAPQLACGSRRRLMRRDG